MRVTFNYLPTLKSPQYLFLGSRSNFESSFPQTPKSRLRLYNHLSRTLTHKLMHLWLLWLMGHLSLAHDIHDTLLCLSLDSMLDELSLRRCWSHHHLTVRVCMLKLSRWLIDIRVAYLVLSNNLIYAQVCHLLS